MILSFSLQQIIDLDEKNQILTTNIWLSLYWHDTYMKWEPEDYGGITVNKTPRYDFPKKNIFMFRTSELTPHCCGSRISSSITVPMRTLTPSILVTLLFTAQGLLSRFRQVFQKL